jgi:sulfate permease, SulP family
VGVTALGTLPGLIVGIGASLVLLLYRVSRPRVAQLGKVPGTQDQYADVDGHPENRPPAGVAIVRVEGGMFFANADSVSTRLREAAAAPNVRAVVLDAETTPFLDVTAVEVLDRTASELERQGVRLLMAHDIGAVRDVLREAGASASLRHIYPTVEAAVDAVVGSGPARVPISPPDK